MVKDRIFDALNDQHQFLKYYLKDNLSHGFYRRAFKKKIKQKKAIKERTLSSDYIQAIREYWEPYEKINLMWHKAYTVTSGVKDVRYIPEDVFYKKIEPQLNRFDLAMSYADKNMTDKLFAKFKMPDTFIRNMNGYFHDKDYERVALADAIVFVQKVAAERKFVIKPSIDTGAGKEVRIVDLRGQPPSAIKHQVTQLFKQYQKDFIIQEYLYQHDLFRQMHKESLNTIRVISLRLEDEIFILSSVVRMGDNGSKVDNGKDGCITVVIDQTHQLHPYGIDHWTYKKYTAHPSSHFVFEDARIPFMKECLTLVKTAHENLHYFDIVSWDLGIDRAGEPNLIEIGVHLQDINYHQRTNGPLFGELTEKVLDKVYI